MFVLFHLEGATADHRFVFKLGEGGSFFVAPNVLGNDIKEDELAFHVGDGFSEGDDNSAVIGGFDGVEEFGVDGEEGEVFGVFVEVVGVGDVGGGEVGEQVDLGGVSAPCLEQGGLVEEREELVRLRRELKRVTEERDILKKAAAYFARG